MVDLEQSWFINRLTGKKSIERTKTMECDEIHSLFMEFQNRVNNQVKKSILPSDYYLNNTNRKPWPNGQGRVFTYPSYERAGLGAAFLGFTPIPAASAGTTCDIPTVEIPNAASTVRSVTLYQSATRTPTFCLRDLEFEWQISQQLSNSVQNMTDATKFNWSQELQNRYIDIAGNKLIYTTDIPTAATWSAIAPTSPLDWDILDYVYEQLRYIATPMDFAGQDEEGKVVLTAVGGYDSFNQLKLQDSNFRADLLAVASGGQETKTLLGSPGMPKGKTFRGWKFETVQFDPRYDLVEGEWVQRFPYELQAATNGQKLEPSTEYKQAGYSDIVVHSKSVFDHLVPAKPQNRNGYDWSDEVDWAGIHKWKKLPEDPDCNPDGSKGYWRSVYAYGPQVQRPDLGWVIRVKRCPRTFGNFACNTVASA